MAYPRFQSARGFKFVNGGGVGNYSTASSSMVATGAALDLTLGRCQVGDVVRLRLTATVGVNAEENTWFNFYSMNRSAYVDSGASANGVDGVAVTNEDAGAEVEWPAVVEFFYTLVAGDLDANQRCRFKVYWRSNGTVTMNNSSGGPIPQFSIENLGPQQV